MLLVGCGRPRPGNRMVFRLILQASHRLSRSPAPRIQQVCVPKVAENSIVFTCSLCYNDAQTTAPLMLRALGPRRERRPPRIRCPKLCVGSFGHLTENVMKTYLRVSGNSSALGVARPEALRRAWSCWQLFHHALSGRATLNSRTASPILIDFRRCQYAAADCRVDDQNCVGEF
jgi:hypothetical protein